MNNFILNTIPYIFILIIIIFVIKKNKQNEHKNEQNKKQQFQKNVFNYSVIPSLAYFTFGHLLLGKKVRENQGWSDEKGVIILQREIGIVELTLFIVACFTTSSSKYVSTIFGLMLVFFGMNHIYTSGTQNVSIASFDIIYGSLLLYIFNY